MSAAVSMSVSNELQGIGSVLGSSEHQRSKTAASLRRTLSADMSSKKWLAKHGFCPLKRIASSEELQTVKKEEEPPGQSDIWSSIMSEKSSQVLATYVHPLAKRSRSLSQQSLEICTESLGSETGSDGFSSVPPSEASDEEPEVGQVEEEEKEEETPVVNKPESGGANCHSYTIKKSPPRSFPPPLPSLSQSGLHVRSHRIDGRLVLEAVPVPAPSLNYFQAQREGGRLLLTLAAPKSDETTNTDTDKLKIKLQKDEDEVGDMFQDKEEEEFNDEEDSEEESEQVVDRGIVFEMKVSQPTKTLPTGVINVHRSAHIVNKLMSLTNIDPTWSPKLEKMVDIGSDQSSLAQSFPPPPLMTRLVQSSASSFNTYDYCWRTKSAAASPTVCTHPLTHQPPPPHNKNNNFLLPQQEQQELVLMKGNKANYLVPVFKGCREPRRSLFWEPHCIAT